MTRAKIVDAAVKLWDSAGPEGFTIRKLAARLKVVPTTIRAHVKGGIAELRREIARRILAELTPPYKPNQDPNDYLREFFRSALESFRQRPTLASQPHVRRANVRDDRRPRREHGPRLGAGASDRKVDGSNDDRKRRLGSQGPQARRWPYPGADRESFQDRIPTLTFASHTLGAKLIGRSEPDYLQERADE